MKQILSVLICTSLLIATYAQKINYKVSFPNALHHEAHIELTASGVSTKPAIFKMSRSSPGRYATHEFGKNVYDVRAVNGAGQEIAVNRIDGDVYEVPVHNGTITLSYTLYGNYSDGTYAGIDPESIHLNMPACFMWLKGMDNAPITISFDIPKENKGIIATQLAPGSDPHTFSAPGLQYFMDSPTKIGDLAFRNWTVSNPDGRNFIIRIALESDASDTQADELASKIKTLVAQAQQVYGEFPSYDFGTYTFIASANPYVHGDGMEHRNSTMISAPLTSFSADRLLGVFSHEYFHNWNVERIRPKTLEPFNFEKSNMSHELWFAEGFTQYYGPLLLTRAGLMNENNFLSSLTSLINTKMFTPGARYYSPVQASNHAVFVDAAVSIDRNNYVNMFTSYYSYGAAIALALDLELQTRFHKTLDAYMQAMWKRFGKNEIPYTIASMEETLASVSDRNFASSFFNRYVTGHDDINYGDLLAKAGYDLKNTYAGRANIGMDGRLQSGKFIIGSNTVKGSAAYEAGLDINDEVLTLDKKTVKSNDDVASFLQTKKPGDKVVVTYLHRNTEKTATMTLGEQPFVSMVPFEQSGKPVTDDMKKIRASWFSNKTK